MPSKTESRMKSGDSPSVRKRCLCCSRKAKNRGLCEADYQAARRKVLDQETTWEDLVAMGLALPSRSGQRGPPNAFLAKFQAAKFLTALGGHEQPVSHSTHPTHSES